MKINLEITPKREGGWFVKGDATWPFLEKLAESLAGVFLRHAGATQPAGSQASEIAWVKAAATRYPVVGIDKLGRMFFYDSERWRPLPPPPPLAPTVKASGEPDGL